MQYTLAFAWGVGYPELLKNLAVYLGCFWIRWFCVVQGNRRGGVSLSLLPKHSSACTRGSTRLFNVVVFARASPRRAPSANVRPAREEQGRGPAVNVSIGNLESLPFLSLIWAWPPRQLGLQTADFASDIPFERKRRCCVLKKKSGRHDQPLRGSDDLFVQMISEGGHTLWQIEMHFIGGQKP